VSFSFGVFLVIAVAVAVVVVVQVNETGWARARVALSAFDCDATVQNTTESLVVAPKFVWEWRFATAPLSLEEQVPSKAVLNAWHCDRADQKRLCLDHYYYSSYSWMRNARMHDDDDGLQDSLDVFPRRVSMTKIHRALYCY